MSEPKPPIRCRWTVRPVSWLPALLSVDHEVDIANNRVINITRPGHIFEHGYVIRSVVEQNGKIFIRTYGEGINTSKSMAGINGVAGRHGFKYLDNRIRRSILNGSPEGGNILYGNSLNNMKNLN